jgi:uncharacterized membrane protein YqjE
MTEQRERVRRFTEELRAGPAASDRSIKEIVQALQPQIQELVNKQVELAKAELAPVGRRAGIAAGLVVTGGVLMLLLLVFLSLTGVYFLHDVARLSYWLSALIVSGILLLIGGILAGVGANILRQLDPKPRRTIAALRENIDWLKGQLKP